MKKVFAVVATLVAVSACQSMGGAGSSGSAAIDNYHTQSRNLPAFTKIPGDKTGARASDRVFFAFDSSVVTSQGQQTLNRQADYLKKHAGVNATVQGHCDERGTREYNLALGERRANASKKFLANAGVASKRLSTISYGKERPAVLGSNENAWAQNRRAVTVLSKYEN